MQINIKYFIYFKRTEEARANWDNRNEVKHRRQYVSKDGRYVDLFKAHFVTFYKDAYN